MRLLVIWILLILLLSFFGIGKALYHEDNTRDIYNVTVNRLQWNSSLMEDKINKNYNISAMNVSGVTIIHLKNIIYKSADTVGYIGMEVAKWGVEVGFRNPEWNYIWLVKWICIIIVVLYCLALIQILPILIALIYLTFIGIKWLIIKIKNWINIKRRGY